MTDYNQGYLDALESERPDPPNMSRNDYLRGYVDGSIDRDDARKQATEREQAQALAMRLCSQGGQGDTHLLG